MGNFGVSIEQRLNPSIARSDQLQQIIMQSARVMLPGIVQSFDAEAGTVSVRVATNEYLLVNTSDDGIALETQATQLPLLTDVPILIPTAGGWSLTFPIKAGDECMLVFADTPLDVWFQNGGVNNNPVNQRRHSLSDPVAVFGVRSTPRILDDYSTDSAQLRSDDGTVVIDLAASGVTVTSPKVTVNSSGQVNIAASGQVSISSGGGSHTLIDGLDVLSHIHSGVQSGGSYTGPPV